MTHRTNSSVLNDEQRQVATNLFRYATWANSLMNRFETVLARDREEMKRQLLEESLVFDVNLLESEMYHCLWFGVLYIVIEGWPRLAVKDQKITKLLRSPYKRLLRDFRNATFHPENYDDKRIKALMANGQASIDWAKEVTKEFNAFLGAILR
ncbi:MAG: hypothetical protein KC425_07100 [Anaerolineales bacterium]|nr:hypothetical protein [Anaerolineales bacterium]